MNHYQLPPIEGDSITRTQSELSFKFEKAEFEGMYTTENTALHQAANHYRWQAVHAPRSIFHDMELLYKLYHAQMLWVKKVMMSPDFTEELVVVVTQSTSQIQINAEQILWDIYNYGGAGDAKAEEYEVALLKLWKEKIEQVYKDYLHSLAWKP